MRKKDYEKQYKKIKKEFKDDSQAYKKKFEKRKKEKQKRYRKTVENWKDELKKGMLDKGLDFDPEMLIKLLMTEDDPYSYKKKQEKRKERLEKEKRYLKIRVSVQK